MTRIEGETEGGGRGGLSGRTAGKCPCLATCDLRGQESSTGER